jgi:Predicted glycosyltransferases
MLKFAGVVSSFYPDLDELERNIKTYLLWLDHLVIWENTPAEDSIISQLIDRLQSNKVEVRTTGQNEFLAYPINECIRWAEKSGYTHLLTMDQDSFFTDDKFELFCKVIENNQDSNIAIFAAAKNVDPKLTGTMVEVKNAITSGAVYPVSIFEKTGFFREDFLIYMIDIEFSIRVREMGFKIVCLPEVVLNHQGGYAQKSKLGLLINHYSAQSTYYIIRNTILTWKLFPEQFPLIERINFFRYKIVYRTIKIVFETNKIQKLKAIYIGLIHGLFGKAGQYSIH